MGVQFSRSGHAAIARYDPVKDFIAGRLTFRELFKQRGRKLPLRLFQVGAVTGGSLLGAEIYFGRLGFGDAEFRRWEDKFVTYREIIGDLRKALPASGPEQTSQTDSNLSAFLDEARLAEIQELLLHHDFLGMMGSKLNLLAILGRLQWKDRFLRLTLDMYEFMVERHRNGNPFIDIQKQLDNVASTHASLLLFETNPLHLEWYWETHFRQLLTMYCHTGFSRASDSVWNTLSRYLVDKSISMENLLQAESEELRERAEADRKLHQTPPEMDPAGLFLTSDISSFPLSASFTLLPPKKSRQTQQNNPARLTLSQVLRALEIAMPELTQQAAAGPCLLALKPLVVEESSRAHWRELGRRSLLGDDHADMMCRQLVSISQALATKIERYRREEASGIVRVPSEAAWTPTQFETSCFIFSHCERTIREMLQDVGHEPEEKTEPTPPAGAAPESLEEEVPEQPVYDDWVTQAQPFLVTGLSAAAKEVLGARSVDHFEETLQLRDQVGRAGTALGLGFLAALLANLRYLRKLFKDDSVILRKWQQARDPIYRKYYGLRGEEERTQFGFADDDPEHLQRGAHDTEIPEDPEIATALLRAEGLETLPEESPPQEEVHLGRGRGSINTPSSVAPRPRKSTYDLADLPAPPPPRPRQFSDKKTTSASGGKGNSEASQRRFSFVPRSLWTAPSGGINPSTSATTANNVATLPRDPFQRRNFLTTALIRLEASRSQAMGVVSLVRCRTSDGKWFWVNTHYDLPSIEPRFYSSRRKDGAGEEKNKRGKKESLATRTREEDLPLEVRKMGQRMAERIRGGRAAPPKLSVHEKVWIQVHQPPKMAMLGTPKHVAKFGSRFLSVLALASIGTFLTILGPSASPSLLMNTLNSDEVSRYVFRQTQDSRAQARLLADVEKQMQGMFSSDILASLHDFEFAPSDEDRFQDFRAPATHQLYDQESFRRLLLPATATLGLTIPLWITTMVTLFPYAFAGTSTYVAALSVRRL